jgi:hypothetical protein
VKRKKTRFEIANPTTTKEHATLYIYREGEGILVYDGCLRVPVYQRKDQLRFTCTDDPEHEYTVRSKAGVVYDHKMWLPKRDDQMARIIFKTLEKDTLMRLNDEIHKHTIRLNELSDVEFAEKN